MKIDCKINVASKLRYLSCYTVKTVRRDLQLIIFVSYRNLDYRKSEGAEPLKLAS